MKRRGRANWLVIAGLAGLVMMVVIYILGRESASSVAQRFMLALAAGDAEKLTDLSYCKDIPKQDMQKKWDYAVHTAGPYYRFTWAITGEVETSGDSAAVKMMLTRAVNTQSSFEEPYDIPMVKTSDGWKVDVLGLNRKVFPALPH